ncbi:MAG: hypothetical protein QOF33_3117 [Thermomicrobiales bacterium]|nr:hypothetical protein [Thermomicrobiales bacterium]
MDKFAPMEQVLLRIESPAPAEPLGSFIEAGECLLTTRTLRVRDGTGTGFTVPLCDVVAVKAVGYQVHVRQRIDGAIEFAGQMWDGWRQPINCADQDQAALLSSRIRSAAGIPQDKQPRRASLARFRRWAPPRMG